MPFYEIHHLTPLTQGQKSELATHLTTIHSTLFSTPKLFVNVSFHDTSSTDTYVAGKLKRGNHIRAHVRTGPGRTREDWEELCRRVEGAWGEVVGPGLPKIRRGDAEQDTSLRSVVVLGDLIHGREVGFTFPEAGGDGQWLEANWGAFEQRARGGDEEIAEMMEECRERGLVGSGGDGRTAQQRLEEELGWGDAA